MSIKKESMESEPEFESEHWFHYGFDLISILKKFAYFEMVNSKEKFIPFNYVDAFTRDVLSDEDLIKVLESDKLKKYLLEVGIPTLKQIKKEDERLRKLINLKKSEKVEE